MYNIKAVRGRPIGRQNGSLAQLGEHLPYKQRVTGSSPVTPTIGKSSRPKPSAVFYGSVVQLVRTLACHARGRGFEPHPSRHRRKAAVVSPKRAAVLNPPLLLSPNLFLPIFRWAETAPVAQLVEQRTENPRVVGSIPIGSTNYALLL